MNELTIHNAEWLASPADTMQAFVGAVLVRDYTYAYRQHYCRIHDAAQRHDWDTALDAAVALRNYAVRRRNDDGWHIARLLMACSLVALRRYDEAKYMLYRRTGALVVDQWHAALAYAVRGIALYATYDTTGAMVVLQDARTLEIIVSGWAAADRSPFSLANEAQRRLVYDVQHRKFRETLAVALREAIERLAVMA